jgi:hypothetical protein
MSKHFGHSPSGAWSGNAAPQVGHLFAGDDSLIQLFLTRWRSHVTEDEKFRRAGLHRIISKELKGRPPREGYLAPARLLSTFAPLR